MTQFAGGGGGKASPRLAKINHHVAGLNSGNPNRVKAAKSGLRKMNLTFVEQAHVHSQMKPPKVGGYAGIGLQHGAKTSGKGGFSGLEHAASTVYHASPLPATFDAFAHPGEFVGKDQSRVTRNNRRQAKAVSSEMEALTGYKQIEQIRQHPIAGSVALAGILPFGRLGRVAELGVDAARGINTAEHAAKVAKAAEEASGLKKLALQRRAVRLGRRTSPQDAHSILLQQRDNAAAKALKAARKNPQFLEHLPGEARPETGGNVGLKVREAMRGVKKVYNKQKELQQVERLKRTGKLAEAQKTAHNFEELAGAQKKLSGQLPKVPFKGFESLRPHLEDIKAHLDSLNILPHDRNRLVQAINKGINGEVPNPSERKLIESVFGREVKNLSPEAIKARGIGTVATDVLNLPRAIESSFDLSGMFRQNLAAIFHSPKLVFKNYSKVLHGTVSESTFQHFMDTEVHANPYFHMAKEDGVPFTELGAKLNQREEAFGSNLAEHLHEAPVIRSTPGVKQVAKGVSAGVRASDRNYVALLNGTRMRLYQSMVEQAAENGWRLDGPQGEKLRKQIGDTVATLTGRGNMGKTLTAHRATFNALFFSPGLMKSRINLLNPVWYVHAEPFARQQRLRTALRMYGTLAGILWAAKMGGAKVVTDPTNADFGKIRVGNTRIDIAGGQTQYMRLIGQLYEGKITSSVTGQVEPLSSGPFKTSRGNVVQSFARNKFSPVPGLAYDALFGAGFGQKLTPKTVAGSMFVPLLMQDMWQIAHAKGPGGGPGMAAETFLPDLFGVGIQNYSGQKKKSGSSPSSPFGGSSGGGDSYFGGGSSSGSSYFP